MSKNPKTPALQSKNGIALYIPTPCNENWDAMTPVEQGRFCQSCAKEVVDFSTMTDQEVLNYFSRSTGNTCGRFNNDQLERSLQPTKIEKKKTWWLVAMMPLMMLVEKAGAQRKSVTSGIPAFIMQENAIKGDTIITSDRNIFGTVKNTAGLPLPFASISINDNYISETDSTGNFKISIPGKLFSIQLQASYIGYNTKKLFISDTIESYDVILENNDQNLAPVTVTTEGYCRTTMTTGAMSVITVGRISTFDTIKHTIFPAFTVYPNPSPRGSNITIAFKNEGEYAIQLFDNSGRLIIIANYNAANAPLQTAFAIPSSLTAGTYYIRLVNEKNKKQYTTKLIVM